MRHHHYYDRAGEPIGPEEASRLLGDHDARRVALDRTSVRGARVEISTVLLVVNHQWNPARPPLIFETLIFGGPDEGYLVRYSTEDEARTGHELIVATYAAGATLTGDRAREPRD